MRAEPKTYYDGRVMTVHVPDGGGLFIECVATDPPSSQGRAVDVFISPEQVVSLLKELRTNAMAARARPMSADD